MSNSRNRWGKLPFVGPAPTPILRAVGLGILNNLKARLWLVASNSEPLKLIEVESATVALQRCAIHILPCAFSLILISLNLKGYFTGFEMAGLPGQNSQFMALLQIAAKVQELLIVASLTTVVAHRLRHDLVVGKGVPFGLIGAGSLFSQASYFWSTAFLGSLSKRSVLNRTLILLVLLAGLLSITAGPAVAVLLIPREHTWPAGGSAYWINGSSEELWPAEVGLEHYMPAAGVAKSGVGCLSEQAYTNALCPAGGLQSLVDRLVSINNSRPWSGVPDSQYVPAEFIIWSPQGQLPPYGMVSAERGKGALESSATAVHGPTAWAAVEMNKDWQDSIYALSKTVATGGSRYRYYRTMRSKIEAQLPTVRAVCSQAQILLSGQQDLQFPVVPAFDTAARFVAPEDGVKNYFPSEPTELRMIQLPNGTLEDRQYRSSIKISTVALKDKEWMAGTIGIVVESAWLNTTSRPVTGCIVDARWAKGMVSVGLAQAVRPEVYAAMKSIKEVSKPYSNNDMFRAAAASPADWRQISVTDDWLRSINLPLAGGLGVTQASNHTQNHTAIEHLISLSTPDSFIPQAIEHTLAVIFADALARAGSWRVLDITQPTINKQPQPFSHVRKPDYQSQLVHGGVAYEKPSSSSVLTELPMQQEITGYAYRSSSLTDYLALSVVLLHLVVAAAHTALLLVRRKSSACWDSVPELLALAHQSEPSAAALQNTATGIERLRTFRQRAWIRVSARSEKHVELAFEGDGEGRALMTPDLREEYGKWTVLVVECEFVAGCIFSGPHASLSI
ncbi:hypothetical protein OPT61_g8572 [Boeremia exigua]|uniref:Uncharacterized protein n=1 Tax=Boeremia exigua TaxID=749465 RepID=A0ACC2HYN1_9PLEO|nr:hypothetical protein OPT61_g8572 [Boeremia exigua]